MLQDSWRPSFVIASTRSLQTPEDAYLAAAAAAAASDDPRARVRRRRALRRRSPHLVCVPRGLSQPGKVDVELRGDRKTCFWNPRFGPPEWSGVLGFGKVLLAELVQDDEDLRVTTATTSATPRCGCTSGPTTRCARPVSCSPRASPAVPSFDRARESAGSRLAVAANRRTPQPDGTLSSPHWPPTRSSSLASETARPHARPRAPHGRMLVAASEE